jgi:hypothetical protein
VERYDFAVLNGDETVSIVRSVALRSMRSAWPRIAELAKNVAGPGCRIRVTNHSGEMVILVGAASARRYFDVVASEGTQLPRLALSPVALALS